MEISVGQPVMNFFKWLTSCQSVRGKVLSRYRKGLARTNDSDRQGAMTEFTAAIEMPDAPMDVKAMALYNRALLFAAAKETPKAIGDLRAVLAMEAPLREIKLAAQRRLDRMQRRHDADGPSPGNGSLSVGF
jgi:hypothetical protein